MINFDTLLLECFIQVVITKSFTKAAHRIGRTQSAVSQQIAKLENMLQVILFNRGKILSLTPDGEIFYEYAQQIYHLQQKAITTFTEPEITGKVSFGLPEDFASVFLGEVLTEFSQKHPHVLLHIECDLTLNLFSRFKNKEFDLVLVKMNRPQDFPNGIDVWSENLEWVGNKKLIEAHKVLPLIVSPKPCVYRARAIQALEKQQHKWRIVFSSHSYASKIAAVQAGLGITVLPKKMVPSTVNIINKKLLPMIADTHISLLKYDENNAAINSLANFVMTKLRQ